ncbi:hypothetical protein [Pseudomonas sp. EMN2]|uniref:hypothetical protein n=1 Tax=Pseudomonas sp. EMN2 TaxID=2615212 RepID=UPI0015B41AEE|nr:hypothetical protein [Pseudomonas sp. EMN2]
MTYNHDDLKATALACDATRCADQAEEERRLAEFYSECTPEVVLALIGEVERLKGLMPEAPPRPPAGQGLPRYGLRWNGPTLPLAVPMDDGYWTPWHLAQEACR